MFASARMQPQDLIDRLNTEENAASPEQTEAGDGGVGDAGKWPAHLLQAKHFRPAGNGAGPAPKSSPGSNSKPRRWSAAVAVVAVAAAGWGGASLWLGQVKPGGSGAQISEVQRLAREENTTLARVLSDLRILQAAYGNVQGQIANLPPKSQLDRLRAEVAAIGKSLSALRKRAAGLEKDRAALVRGLSERLDAQQAESAKRVAALTRRLEQLEKAKADPTPVATIAASRVARSEPQSAAPSRARGKRTAPHGYVLRDVYGGAALVEARNGRLLEVVPGMRLPRAGRVRSIERRRGQWIVVTSNGVIDAKPY